MAAGNAAPKQVGGKVGPVTKHIVSSLLDGASAPVGAGPAGRWQGGLHKFSLGVGAGPVVMLPRRVLGPVTKHIVSSLLDGVSA